MNADLEIRTDLSHLPGEFLMTHSVHPDTGFTNVGFNLAAEGDDSFPFIAVMSLNGYVRIYIYTDDYTKPMSIEMNGRTFALGARG